MIGKNLDRYNQPVNDYDLVWIAIDGCIYLGCVKKVKRAFKRTNPNYYHNSYTYSPPKPPEPHYITGTEDKYLIVYAAPNSDSHTVRLDSIHHSVVKVNDFTILNSSDAHKLIERTHKEKS